MYIFLMIVHVFVCLVLIIVVLLQAGRGGGMSDMMGGGQPSTLFGTQTNAFMTRATEICAVLFIVTSLSLGILSTQRGKSVMERRGFANAVNQSLPAIPASGAPITPAATTPIAVTPQPVATPEPVAVPAAPAAEASAASVPAEAAKP